MSTAILIALNSLLKAPGASFPPNGTIYYLVRPRPRPLSRPSIMLLIVTGYSWQLKKKRRRTPLPASALKPDAYKIITISIFPSQT